MYLINFIRGFCMALADSVPGVSGGTIAFILGFYDKFIGSLDDLITGKKAEKIEALKFLIKIGIGWIVGFVLAMLFLGKVFTTHIYNLSFTIIGIVIVAGITYFNPAKGGVGVSIDNLSLGLSIYIFICAMIAISAMVLPGISGSTLLLIFGLYAPVVNAVKEVLHFNLKYLPVVLIFGFGVLTGIFSIIKFVRILLKKYRSQTVYLILGLMIGSIYAVFMGPTSLEIPKDPMTLKTFNLVFFVIGGIIIVGLQKLKSFFDKK